MKMSAILIGGVCLFSASVAFGQSHDPRDPSCACAKDDASRLAASPRYFLPAGPTPIPVVIEPRVRRTPVTTRSVARWNPASVESVEQCAPLQVSVPEGLLNRLLADERSEIAPVRDVIARADVFGRQSTATRVVVDVKPSNSHGEIHLVLTGAVHSDTVGMTSQAAVKTFGRHDVLAVKPVMFDGYQITTKRPRVWVDVHNEHVAASTPFDGTLFGGLARSTALKTANRQRTQVDAETAEHLAAQLGPQFNREADRQLAQFNREWRDNLRSQFGDLWPQRLTARSTDSELVLSAAWEDAPAMKWSGVNRSGSSPSRETDNNTVMVWLHESVLNAWLRSLGLGGKTMTETELRDLLETFVTKLGGRVLPRENKLAAQPLPGAAPLIRFGEKDPVRISIADAELRLTVHAAIEVAGQTVLAQDEITMPFSSKIERGEWRVTPGQLAFAKADDGVTLAGVVESLVRNQLAAAMPDVVLPNVIPLPANLPADSMPPLRLARAEAAEGWLTLSLSMNAPVQAQPKAEPQPEPEEAAPLEIVPPRLIGPRLQSSRDPRGWFR